MNQASEGLPMLVICFFKSILRKEFVFKPDIVYLKLLSVKIGKRSCIRSKIKDQFVGAKTLFFQSAFFVQLVCPVFSVALYRMTD